MLFKHFHPNVKALATFLRLINVKAHVETVNEALQNHPDWPSLLSISDTLSKWQVPNAAGKINPMQLDELPTPFLTNSNKYDAPIAIVTQVTDAGVQVLQDNYTKAVTLKKEEFLKHWDGFYMIAEPGSASGEPGFENNRKKVIWKTALAVLTPGIILILSFLSVRKLAGAFHLSEALTTGFYLQYVLLMAGVIVSSLLVWYEIDRTNPVLKKVCTGMSKGNCSAILNSRHAKLFHLISWSEIGAFFFAGGLLTLLSGRGHVTEGVTLIAWLSILAVPYTLFSIYYQWQVARQWCVLCLAIQAILVLGALNAVLHGLLLPLSALSVSFVIQALLLYLLPALVWYIIKPYILELQAGISSKRQYLRTKFNIDIFSTLLSKQRSISHPIEGLGIDLGNPAAPHTLVKVCSTHCGPCSKAHPKIEKLLHENPGLNVKIIFAGSGSEYDPSTKPISHLLAIDAQGDKAITKRALNDWYLSNDKNYDHFAARYPVQGELQKQKDRISAMYNWCKQMKITQTPTYFINGYELPDVYDIEDLQYFLLEFDTASSQ